MILIKNLQPRIDHTFIWNTCIQTLDYVHEPVIHTVVSHGILILIIYPPVKSLCGGQAVVNYHAIMIILCLQVRDQTRHHVSSANQS